MFATTTSEFKCLHAYRCWEAISKLESLAEPLFKSRTLTHARQSKFKDYHNKRLRTNYHVTLQNQLYT